MDFKKAFDSVPHSRLISKLNALGVQGRILKWTAAFLTGRSQRVQVNGCSSTPAAVTSGIPQGSVLGHTLFVMYIIDLPKELSNTVKLFTDDTKLYARSDTVDLTNSIQTDLNKLQEWSRIWQLEFHPQKCNVLKLGTTKSAAQYYMQTTPGDVTKLADSKIEKDLGVTVDNHLSFKEHIASAVAKAIRVLGVIRRSFQQLDRDTFVTLYKSMVRPILEYGHAVWQPHLKGLQRELESVQRRATRMLAELRPLPYNKRLRALKGIGTSQTSKYVFGVFTYLSYRFHTHMNNRGA